MAKTVRPLASLQGAVTPALWAFTGIAAVLSASIVGFLVINPVAFMAFAADDASYAATDTELALSLGLSSLYLVYMGAWLVCGFLVLRWTFRAQRNLRLLDREEAQMAPGWAVGWYFVPLANLWKPLEGMQQIRDGSFLAANRYPEDGPQLAGWWAVWLGALVAGRISTADEWTASAAAGWWFEAASLALFALAAFLLIGITRRITEAQTTVIQASAFEDTPGPSGAVPAPA